MFPHWVVQILTNSLSNLWPTRSLNFLAERLPTQDMQAKNSLDSAPQSPSSSDQPSAIPVRYLSTVSWEQWHWGWLMCTNKHSIPSLDEKSGIERCQPKQIEYILGFKKQPQSITTVNPHNYCCQTIPVPPNDDRFRWCYLKHGMQIFQKQNSLGLVQSRNESLSCKNFQEKDPVTSATEVGFQLIIKELFNFIIGPTCARSRSALWLASLPPNSSTVTFWSLLPLGWFLEAATKGVWSWLAAGHCTWLQGSVRQPNKQTK